jgi:hypothetical protein
MIDKKIAERIVDALAAEYDPAECPEILCYGKDRAVRIIMQATDSDRHARAAYSVCNRRHNNALISFDVLPTWDREYWRDVAAAVLKVK